MDNFKMYPDIRFSHAARAISSQVSSARKCGVDDIANISDDIILRKRISLILLLAFIPLLTAVYLISSKLDVNAAYIMAFAVTYAVYYFIYSIWACSSHCPTCGKSMNKRYHFIMPSMTCSHCGHDLRHPAKMHKLTI